MKEIDASFFARDTLEVARCLLGKIISVGGCSGRIVEVEAYKDDEASHAFSRTPRSEMMYSTYGQVYVYFIYGMYHCLNFTTEHGKPGAVLIRAVEPLTGIEKMKKRRKTEKINQLCSGPGKLCQAFGIDGSFNGKMVGKMINVYEAESETYSIGVSSRIGIQKALDLNWRFFIEGNEFVSRK